MTHHLHRRVSFFSSNAVFLSGVQIDAVHFVVIRMWKGYRDAQCAFIKRKPSSQQSTSASASTSANASTTAASSAAAKPEGLFGCRERLLRAANRQTAANCQEIDSRTARAANNSFLNCFRNISASFSSLSARSESEAALAAVRAATGSARAVATALRTKVHHFPIILEPPSCFLY